MRITLDPALARWSPSPGNSPQGILAPDRQALSALALDHARKWGTGQLNPRQPLIATGHQAWLWHPGILAKDLACLTLARKTGKPAAAPHADPEYLASGGGLHLVVDQDVFDAGTLDLPLLSAQRLETARLQLFAQQPDVPTGCHPPISSAQVVAKLTDFRKESGPRLPVDLDPLIHAWENLPACETLAAQLAVVLHRLRQWCLSESSAGLAAQNLAVVFVSQLAALPSFARMLDDLRTDARRGVEAYNLAARQEPSAGILPLRVEADRVELPVWALRWRQPRARVFAMGSGPSARLILEDNSPVELGKLSLAPRALLLTALLRRGCCDLFIHGRGGGHYDQVMERWWSTWKAEPLAPKTVVSADVFLSLPAPVAEPADLVQARWRVHHLPHNLDRVLNLSGPQVQRKRSLLATMDQDRDRHRRKEAFADLHRLNQEFVEQHPDAIRAAFASLETARTGLANRAVAQRRDWCFALYPPTTLRQLTEEILKTLPVV
ncbi:MAG: hypothetical protein IT443_08995 [Phycisphaeraceae bacterium]|nr:hypothetical protein [Phycisphaeraceae bacterium]